MEFEPAFSGCRNDSARAELAELAGSAELEGLAELAELAGSAELEGLAELAELAGLAELEELAELEAQERDSNNQVGISPVPKSEGPGHAEFKISWQGRYFCTGALAYLLWKT
jgi:hypothetical protein